MGRWVTVFRKWLYLGLGIKRWLLLLLAGTIILGVGFAYLFYDLYVSALMFSPVWRTLTLSFIPRWTRILVIELVGLGLVATAVYQLNRSLLSAFLPAGRVSVVDVVYQHRQRQRGPKVVVLGGGNGLGTLLRGLKYYTDHITAIVTVADDGGSSGRLRREWGTLPPGDFRNCIAALADDEALTTQLFQYRFPSLSSSADNDHSLAGHSFGNLFILALAAVTGSFEKALIETGRVLAVKGQILPSTLRNVTLVADLVNGTAGLWRVHGESAIPEVRKPIERVYLDPPDVPAYPAALRAILDADLILAGPGSLYTSVLPNLLVDDIARAVRSSDALKIYVCNVATQRGETEGYTVEDHVRAMEQHTGPGLFPCVLANSNIAEMPDESWNFSQVKLAGDPAAALLRYEMVLADIVDEDRPWRHDPDKLARALFEKYAACVRKLDAV
jgi:uncharacterized cofD-like protein